MHLLSESKIKNNPLVSIIVLAYNQEETISETLDSILAQKCLFPFEIIIGDDCSTDNTQKICAQYMEQFPNIVRTVFHKINCGVATNFVLSIRQAIGHYISICAADDFWHNSNKLQLQVDFFKCNSVYGLVYTDYDILDIKGKIVNNYIKKSCKTIHEGNGLMKNIFYGQVPIAAHTVMFRKYLFDEYIPTEDYIKFRFPLEDWPTWLILSKYTKIGYINISTATYRYNQESISHSMHYEKIKNRFNKEKIMYKYLCERFPEDLPYDETGYNIYVKNVLLNLAYKKLDHLAAKKYAQELKELGFKNIKSKFAKNWFLFIIFSLLKKSRSSLKKYSY